MLSRLALSRYPAYFLTLFCGGYALKLVAWSDKAVQSKLKIYHVAQHPSRSHTLVVGHNYGLSVVLLDRHMQHSAATVPVGTLISFLSFHEPLPRRARFPRSLQNEIHSVHEISTKHPHRASPQHTEELMCHGRVLCCVCGCQAWGPSSVLVFEHHSLMHAWVRVEGALDHMATAAPRPLQAYHRIGTYTHRTSTPHRIGM